MTIRVAITEDDRDFRRAVELAIEHTPGFELVGSFGSVEALVARLADPSSMAAAWDVVLMDLDLPGASGIEGIRRLKASHPGVSVVVCTVFEEPATIVDAIGAGADGYLLKGASLDELLGQLRLVVDGGSSLTGTVARTLLDVVREGVPRSASSSPSRLDLSGRERDVLKRLVEGMSYKQIAADLDISENTVRTYIRRLYRKLQVQSVAEAVSRAIRERLV